MSVPAWNGAMYACYAASRGSWDGPYATRAILGIVHHRYKLQDSSARRYLCFKKMGISSDILLKSIISWMKDALLPPVSLAVLQKVDNDELALYNAI